MILYSIAHGVFRNDELSIINYQLSVTREMSNIGQKRKTLLVAGASPKVETNRCNVSTLLAGGWQFGSYQYLRN